MIKRINENELKTALGLVEKVFLEFVAWEYSEQGVGVFKDYISNPGFLSENDAWGYYINDEIAGVVSTRGISHISLFFVDKVHQRKGIGRELFEIVRSDTFARSEALEISVNSSPYAVKFYESLGFVKKGGRREKSGMVFFPLIYLLNYRKP